MRTFVFAPGKFNWNQIQSQIKSNQINQIKYYSFTVKNK